MKKQATHQQATHQQVTQDNQRKHSHKAFLPVFKPGSHTAMDGRTITFTQDNCIDLAESYDPNLLESPLVIGHPKLTAPAYGWAKSFEFRDGVLYAEPYQIAPAFAEAFNQGSYKKRSLSFYLPDSPGNPKPGHYYPRHIGFLGAVPPAVKGLEDVSFSEAEDSVEFAMTWGEENLIDVLRNLREHMIATAGIEKANEVIPNSKISSMIESFGYQSERLDRKLNQVTMLMDNLTTNSTQSNPIHFSEETMEKDKQAPTGNSSEKQPVEFADREAKLAEREAALRARENELQKQEAEKTRADAVSFADNLAKEGKILPRQQTAVVEVLLTLGNGEVSFSDNNQIVTQSASEIFKDLLNTRSAVIDFAEKSPADNAHVDFADADALASAAQQYQTEQAKLGKTVSMSQAVAYVSKGK